MPSSLRAERALDVLNVVLADVRYGLGPYGAIYLMAEHGWDEASLALAYSFGGIVGLLSQAPLGVAVDAVRAKRALLAGAVLVVAASCLLIVLVPRFWPVAAAGIVAALAGNTLLLTIAAISLGIVGPTRFARRAGRNEALFHTGNACVNLVILATAPLFGLAAVFWALAATVLASVAAVLAIPAEAIDYAVARGLPPDAAHVLQPSALGVLLASRPLLAFAGCGAVFHLANASLLALVVQRATRADPDGAVAFAAACNDHGAAGDGGNRGARCGTGRCLGSTTVLPGRLRPWCYVRCSMPCPTALSGPSRRSCWKGWGWGCSARCSRSWSPT